MKAAYYTVNGEPEVLTYGDLPDPKAKEGEVVVRVQAVSLEGGDVLSRRNMAPPTTPYVVGYAAAGVIASIGPGVIDLDVGQRVACFNWKGSHAELFAVPQHFVFPVPDALEIDAAAVGLIAFGTAHDGLFEFGALQKGETVLVQGAAGGVGLAAVQLAHRAGAKVIATASTLSRLAKLRDFGATHGIDYRDEDIAQRALSLTDGKGVDMVIDLAGGKAQASLLKTLRYRGRYIPLGGASGERVAFEIADLAPNSLAIITALFGKELHTPRVHAMIQAIFDDMAGGSLTMPIDKKFALSQAAHAHRHAEEGHPFGRIVLVP